MQFTDLINWMRDHHDENPAAFEFTVIVTGPGIALASTREKDGHDDPWPAVKTAHSVMEDLKHGQPNATP